MPSAPWKAGPRSAPPCGCCVSMASAPATSAYSPGGRTRGEWKRLARCGCITFRQDRCSNRCPTALCDDLGHHARRELIRKPFLQAVVLHEQIAIVHAQQVQNGRVKIMYAHAILHSFETDIVGGAV